MAEAVAMSRAVAHLVSNSGFKVVAIPTWQEDAEVEYRCEHDPEEGEEEPARRHHRKVCRSTLVVGRSSRVHMHMCTCMGCA